MRIPNAQVTLDLHICSTLTLKSNRKPLMYEFHIPPLPKTLHMYGVTSDSTPVRYAMGWEMDSTLASVPKRWLMSGSKASPGEDGEPGVLGSRIEGYVSIYGNKCGTRWIPSEVYLISCSVTLQVLGVYREYINRQTGRSRVFIPRVGLPLQPPRSPDRSGCLAHPPN